MTDDRGRGSYNADDSDRPRWREGTTPEATYEYRDADGNYLFEVQKGRTSEGRKTFRQRRKNMLSPGERLTPEDHRDYLPGRGDVAPVLYRLPELLAADPSEPVFIVEGEKDVDRLRAEGCVAICNPDGALKWRDDFAPYLAGREVVVLPDNDERGSRHAEQVVRSVREYARRVRVLALEELGDGEDVSDWLDKGYNGASLLGRVARDAVDKSWERTQNDALDNQSEVNIQRALRLLGSELRYDEFARRMLIDGRYLDDAEVMDLWFGVRERFGLRPAKEFFFDVVAAMARRNSFHPVKDYLAGLSWDGVGRIDGWLVQYCAAEDNPYVRAVGRLMLLAAVKRVHEPGCKFDEMVVLQGAQGCGKSSALKMLAVHDEWFTDEFPLTANDSKQVIEQASGHWIMESAELKGMRKAEVEHLKAFLSRSRDKARMAYGRLPEEVPRQFIIVGTTNAERFLIDDTGNRRFWPVSVGKVDLEAFERDRDQLWAEAAHLALAHNASLRLDPELYEAAAREQAAREIENPFLEPLQEALGDLTGKIKCGDIRELLGIAPERYNQTHKTNLGRAMQELGWGRKKLRHGGTLCWCYRRGNEQEAARELALMYDYPGRPSVQPRPDAEGGGAM